MSGNPQAYHEVYNLCKQQGEIVLMDLLETTQPMDWRPVIFKQLTVVEHAQAGLFIAPKLSTDSGGCVNFRKWMRSTVLL